jgi:PhnB protein
MSGLIPYLTITGGRGAEAVDFYKRAFDAEELGRHPADDGRRLLHAHLRINGDDLMLSDDFPEFRGGVEAGAPAGVTLHLAVFDADPLWSRATGAGAEVLMPLADQFWGDRYGQLRDPYGHVWSVGAPSREPDQG